MKKLLALLLVAVLTVSFTACTGINMNSNSKDGGSGGKFEYGQDYINKHMPESYWLVYNITTYYEDSGSDNSTWEQIKTPEGYYFSYGGGSGQLYITNGDNYDAYYKNSDDIYESAGYSVSKEDIESTMSLMMGYMTMYSAFSDTLKRDGNEKVMGKDCEKYTADYTIPFLGFSFKYSYCIDKSTGVCLKYTMELMGGGHKTGTEFECVKFETSNIKLPEYKKPTS